MSDNVCSVTEIVGSSSKSIEHAIDNAIATASPTLRNLEWFNGDRNTRTHRRREGRPLPETSQTGVPL